jgi:hypothetical protein
MKCLTLNAPTKKIDQYFGVKMDSWHNDGLNVNLTKNTYGPCASFLLKQCTRIRE